jgi:hypothetical protein
VSEETRPVHPDAMPAKDVSVLVKFLLEESPFVPRAELRDGIENWVDHHFPNRVMTNAETIESLETMLEFHREIENQTTSQPSKGST